MYLFFSLQRTLFIEGRTPERNIVNHKDENKLNPHYINLEWVTTQENIIYSANKKRYQKVIEEVKSISLTIKYRVKEIKRINK